MQVATFDGFSLTSSSLVLCHQTRHFGQNFRFHSLEGRPYPKLSCFHDFFLITRKARRQTTCDLLHPYSLFRTLLLTMLPRLICSQSDVCTDYMVTRVPDRFISILYTYCWPISLATAPSDGRSRGCSVCFKLQGFISFCKSEVVQVISLSL